MNIKPLKVSEINRYIKKLLNNDPVLYNISVEGEISNFKHHYSGHMYFSLKDKNSRIKCVMFSNDCSGLKFTPEDGMSVIVKGYISVYERNGQYQLYVKEMVTKGVGELYIEFERLKEKLKKEGLFDESRKKPIPYIPKKIGVVTSSKGAAIKDIITVIKRRLPTAEIVVYPALVQGERAHIEICKGLKYFNSRNDIDLIITGRGGGSIEELWAFNEEDVARTIYELEIPVISAVGHETDFTIADFVADLRAPTPSAAGELAVPNANDLKKRLDELSSRLIFCYDRYINEKSALVEKLNENLIYFSPVKLVNENRQRLDYLAKDLINAYKKFKDNSRKKVDKLGSNLNVLSPLSVLSRGYSLAVKNNGKIVKSVKDLNNGDKFDLILSDGRIKAKKICLKADLKGDGIYE
ncbi:exodeoxyribonuclease VII large subunit [Thermohalobacter berrensis]|uniref:Exodeoxyribonuclease 7 large subunit n=1 Tax=Thermohalobacter berrensis TaxID=99594 RepID=A0A419TAQ6_9FIRM|nr:exodeoxyribonuclease VII large subunit [Thermohalobacter berrensis]RKD34566.1 exodeoxyribonuclease VII large subunit [Thermohalobacter berrensis]